MHINILVWGQKLNIHKLVTLHLKLPKNWLKIDIKYGCRRNKIICHPLMISTFWDLKKNFRGLKILIFVVKKVLHQIRNIFQGISLLHPDLIQIIIGRELSPRLRLEWSRQPSKDLLTSFNIKRVGRNFQSSWKGCDF